MADKPAEKPAQDQADEAENQQQAATVNPATPKVRAVRGVTKDGVETAEVVTAVNKPNLQESGEPLKTEDQEEFAAAPEKEAEACWNCKEPLNEEDKCEACGFDKSTLYNMNVEAQKERERQGQ